MKKELRLTIDNLGKWSPAGVADDAFGFENENQAVTLRIDLPTYALSAQHFIEFLKPSGESVSSGSLSELDDQGSKYIEYKLGSALLDEKGRYHIQYVGRKTSAPEMTFKSELKAFDVKRSVNAGVEIVDADPDFITWATREIAALSAAISVLPAMDTAIGDLTTRLTRLEGLISETIYMGVIFYGSETVGDRLGAAHGLRAGVNGAPNDFDSMPIYKDIRVYESENGDVIWECPSFYVKHLSGGSFGTDDWYEAFYISKTQIDDTWGLHVAFLDKDKNNRGKMTLSAYKASEESGKLVSKSNANIAVNYTLEQFRAMAALNGAHIAEKRKLDAVNILFMIEFATRDGQSIFKGLTYAETFYPTDDLYLQEESPTNIARINITDREDEDIIADRWQVGTLMVLVNDNDGLVIDDPEREVVGIQFIDMQNPLDPEVTLRVVEITFSGTPADYSDESYYWSLMNVQYVTGLADDLPGSSHETLNLPDGLRHFSYRGLENYWGVVYEMTDGEGIKMLWTPSGSSENTASYVMCFDPSHYDELNWNSGSDRTMSHFEEVKSITSNSGYLASIYHSPTHPGSMAPDLVDNGASSASYYCDYCGIYKAGNTANPSKTIAYCLSRGGDASVWDVAGPFSVRANLSVGAYGFIGTRLSFDPS